MRSARIASLLLSVFLQLAPLVRVAVADAAAVLSPLVAILRWAAGTAAVAGSFHAVSGATGLTVTQGSSTNKFNLGVTGTINCTNGLSTGIRVLITSSEHGTAKSYRATGLPTGLTVTSTLLGVIAGIPTTNKTFTARITGYKNANQTGDNASFNLNFRVVDGVPVITAEPVSVTVDEGQAAALAVAATGSGLTYRWIKGGVELPATIPGATNPAITFNPAKLSDGGDYQVRVTSSGGSKLSATAVLTVNPVAVAAPVIGTPPAAATVPVGGRATFTVAATGGDPLTYQWLKGTAPLAGQTAATLTLDPVTVDSGGTYTVRVSNAGGSAEAAAALTVAPAITAQSVGPIVVHPGETVRLTVTAAGPAPLTYAWRRGDQPLTNASQAELVLDPVTAAEAGSYIVTVGSPGATVESRATAVEVRPLRLGPPQLTDGVVRLNWSAIAGRTYRLEAGATLAGPWRTAGRVTPAGPGAAQDEPADTAGEFFRLVPE